MGKTSAGEFFVLFCLLTEMLALNSVLDIEDFLPRFGNICADIKRYIEDGIYSRH